MQMKLHTLPNPFSKETTFEFTFNTAQTISITIYNELGQIVKNLTAGNYVNEGKFQVVWDGTNNGGGEVSNGAYFYKISGENGEIKSGKLLLKR